MPTVRLFWRPDPRRRTSLRVVVVSIPRRLVDGGRPARAGDFKEHNSSITRRARPLGRPWGLPLRFVALALLSYFCFLLFQFSFAPLLLCLLTRSLDRIHSIVILFISIVIGTRDFQDIFYKLLGIIYMITGLRRYQRNLMNGNWPRRRLCT